MENGNHRVVVTGMGAITPLAHNVADTWSAILAGKSGFGPFTVIEKGEHTSGGLCEVKDFDPNQYMDRRDARRRDPRSRRTDRYHQPTSGHLMIFEGGPGNPVHHRTCLTSIAQNR